MFGNDMNSALLLTRFETWKEATGKTDFVEFLQRPNESERVQEILETCATDYRTVIFQK